MSALSQVIDHLDEATIRKMILPKTKQLFDTNADTKVGQSALDRLTANSLGTALFHLYSLTYLSADSNQYFDLH